MDLGLWVDAPVCPVRLKRVQSRYRDNRLLPGLLFDLLRIHHSPSGVASQHYLCRLLRSRTRLSKEAPIGNNNSQTQNRILATLPASDYQRLQPHLEHVDLTHGVVLYERGGTIKYLYFPFYAMVSLVTEMNDGKIVEVGLVGNDGMTGLAAVLGEKISWDRAIVQIPGGGMRAKLEVVLEEFRRGGVLHDILLRYAVALTRQVGQTAACNASHTTGERLSRWLLMCHDRVEGSEIKLTQESIAEMLGTRRATVSVAAIALQSAGLIKYSRGNITITDRPGLESFSCECYAAVNGSGSKQKKNTN